MIVPGLGDVDEQAPQHRPFVVDVQEQLRRDRAKHPDLQAQAALKEKLRYHGYVRAGTLGSLLQSIGNGVRSGEGPWFWIAVAMGFSYAFHWFGFRIGWR